MIILRQCGTAVKHHDEQFRLFAHLSGTPHPFLFHSISRGANSCRIDDAEQETVEFAGDLNSIAGRTGMGRHDSPVTTDQGIEQTGLANVGTTDNCHGQALPRHPPPRKRGYEACHVFAKQRQTVDQSPC